MIRWNNFENSAAVTMSNRIQNKKIGVGQGKDDKLLDKSHLKLFLEGCSHCLQVHGNNISRQPKKDLLHGYFRIL